MEAQQKTFENPLYKYRNTIIISILGLIVLLFLVLNSKIFTESVAIIKQINNKYIFYIVGLVLFSWLLDALLLHISVIDQKITFWDSLKINFAGSFFSGITPYAIASHPSRVYYFYKQDIDIETSASGVMLKGFLYQASLLLLALGGLIGARSVVIKMENYRFILTIGFMYNLVLFLAAIIIAISNKTKNVFIKLISFIINKKKKATLFGMSEDEFVESINNFAKQLRAGLCNIPLVGKMFAITIIRLIIYNLIPIIILHSIGFDVKSAFFALLSLSALIRIIITIVPTPGGVVAAEGAFVLLFGLVYQNSRNHLTAVMLMWRFFTHYILIIVGFIFVVILQLQNRR